MTFLPIVARELRVASRRRATYWSRSVTAVLAIITGLIVFLYSANEPPHDVGQHLFQVLSILAFVYCIAVGIRSTSDCLSEEKREGTLGLLFLTDLKGYDVVGGKLVATSLNAFYGLTAIFPVLAIPLLMGGITNGEFWRMALVLANTFLFSLAIGMFISSISKFPRRAMAATLILLLVFSIGLPILEAWIPRIYRSHSLTHIFDLLTPENAMGFIGDLDYRKQQKEFWWSVGVIQGICWVCLLLASVIAPRSWQDNPPGSKAVRRREIWHRWSYGDQADRAAFRRRLLNANAFFWLAGRARLKPLHVWCTLAGITCLWIWGAVEYGADWTNEVGYVLTAIVLNTTMKIWVASEAGRRLGEDRKIGSLELLLSTPLSIPDILRGQMLALRRQFLGPVLTVIVINCVFLVASVRSGHEIGSEPALVAVWISWIIMLVADVLALSAVAMWVSLTSKNPNRATGITLTRVMVMPTVLWVGILIFRQIMTYASSGSDPSWKFVLGLWFGLRIVTDAFFGLNAWRRLHAEFREVAVQRYAAPTSLFRRIFSARSSAG